MEIELRIILLVVGVIILVVVGVDLYRRRPQVHETEHEPVLGAFDDGSSNVDDIDVMRQEQEQVSLQYDPVYPLQSELPEIEPTPIPDNILTITIRSRDAYGFKGANLLHAIKKAHLHFGNNDVFYRYETEDGKGETLFSLVKATEPGYFYLETLMQEHVPGVTLILITDAVSNPLFALDKLVRTAKQMAFSLNAELLDDKRQPLTLETIEHYKRQAQAR